MSSNQSKKNHKRQKKDEKNHYITKGIERNYNTTKNCNKYNFFLV